MTQYTHPTTAHTRPSYSIPAILALVCAIASFFFGAGFGFLLAVLAIILGIIGVLMAFAPGVRGGMVSILAVVAGALGIIAALFKLIF